MTISLEEFRAVASEAERYRRERDYWMAQAKATAERQREADIDHCLVWLGHANVGVPLDQFMRDTPLVTEGDK